MSKMGGYVAEQMEAQGVESVYDLEEVDGLGNRSCGNDCDGCQCNTDGDKDRDAFEKWIEPFKEAPF